MDIIFKIGIPGWLILVAQFSVFAIILRLGLEFEKSSRSLRTILSRCLRESRDLVSDNDMQLSLARDCATRYRIAATRIEDVDAYAIANSEISRATAIRLFKRSWSYPKIDELLHGGSGFLVTLGLIGTFFGLMANMVQLSELVLASEDGSQQASLMQGLAAVFPSMAAAFTTSLVGVLLSSILWIFGTTNGLLTLKDELTELLSGYLEQVVQVDLTRYSLVGETMERMEKYMTNFLSTFSESVGDSIEQAIMNNIASLVSALKYQVDQITSLVARIKDGSEKLSDAGLLFHSASQVLGKSDFAERFGEACDLFLISSEQFSKSSELLVEASGDAASSCKELVEAVELSSSVTESLGSSLIEAKDSTIQLLSLGVTSIERLKDATGAIEGIQKRGMTWLSMRAKTDQQLMEINSQLNDVIANIAEVASRVASTRAADIAEIQSSISSVKEIANSLSAAIKQQENTSVLVVEGLEQMQSVAARISAMDPQL
jgi:hypothetical protein